MFVVVVVIASFLMTVAYWFTLAHGNFMIDAQHQRSLEDLNKVQRRIKIAAMLSTLLMIAQAVMFVWAGYELGVTTGIQRYAALEGVEMPVLLGDEPFMQQDAR